MANPTTIDMNLVNAQKARQVLDLIVGHKTTPVLWANVPSSDKPLSAGRCQTPALRLVYDNYKESASSVERTVYKIVGQFIKSPFVLKETLATAEEVQRFLSLSIDWSHVYIGNRTSTVIKSAPKPFTTARLLQTASNELRFSPSDTMKLAQTLYEAGRITYMRTDSEHYCTEFLETVKLFVDKKWGEKWNKQNTNKENKEAHEAIRPTHLDKEINFEKFISDLSDEGLDVPSNLSLENIDSFLNENDDSLEIIFSVALEYGFGKLLEDYYSDESNFHIDSHT
jgi:DNA topoisomerase-1